MTRLASSNNRTIVDPPNEARTRVSGHGSICMRLVTPRRCGCMGDNTRRASQTDVCEWIGGTLDFCFFSLPSLFFKITAKGNGNLNGPLACRLRSQLPEGCFAFQRSWVIARPASCSLL